MGLYSHLEKTYAYGLYGKPEFLLS